MPTFSLANISSKNKKQVETALLPGLYTFHHQDEGEQSWVHLRIDSDGRGTLIVNANRFYHLNPTATIMSSLILQKISRSQVVKYLRDTYKVSEKQVADDYTLFEQQLEELIHPDTFCPIHDLDLEINPPFHSIPSAPYRMDLALTYRCNNACSHCYNDRARDFGETTLDSWIAMVNRIVEIGIPHVVFTGGEPTLYRSLIDLIKYTNRKGLITGLNTNARRLSDPLFTQKLVDVGLDHVQITLESHDSGIHDHLVGPKGAWQQTVLGLENALDTRLYVMTNTTMLRENSLYIKETLDFLTKLGVPTIGFNALIYSGQGKTVNTGLQESELFPLLTTAQEHVQTSRQRLIWYSPTQYCKFDPMELELGVKGCTAALYNMCVEPNGDVLPCQSYYHPVGNLLLDPWSSIWNHELCKNLRERRFAPSKCSNCALLKECGGGCPLSLETKVLQNTITINE